MKKALEKSRTTQSQCQLILDEPLHISFPNQACVIILFPEEDDIDEKEWHRAAASNPVFGFLEEKEEDIYSLNDGGLLNE